MADGVLEQERGVGPFERALGMGPRICIVGIVLVLSA